MGAEVISHTLERGSPGSPQYASAPGSAWVSMNDSQLHYLNHVVHRMFSLCRQGVFTMKDTVALTETSPRTDTDSKTST